MEKETQNIRKEAMHSAWAMRGGLSYEQALMLSTDERAIVANIIKDNLEITKKTKLPYF